MSENILRLPAVKQRTGYSQSSIYRKVKEGTFPKPIPLGARAVGWLESDVNAWIERQVELARTEAA